MDKTVGRPELQKFGGAIPERNAKGLFVTTAKFSTDAKQYAFCYGLSPSPHASISPVCACSYYIYGTTHIFRPPHLLAPREYARNLIASTLMLPEAILSFTMSGHRFNDALLCHFTQQSRASCRFQAKHPLNIRPSECCFRA